MDTSLCLYRGVTHEFFGMGSLLPEARDAQAAAGKGLNGDALEDARCRLLPTPTTRPGR